MSAFRPSTLLGAGKVEEYRTLIEAEQIEVVIVDAPLTPVQQRNLERAVGSKVIDRTGLILEIFGERARTAEGRLQVELANLSYQRTRLVRAWTHLERQRGGLGAVGGPGETQIEADRRMLDDRIVQLKRKLEQVTRTRELHRKTRREAPYPVVALVGYTNAGKSTLFNRLTEAKVLARDMLFATLDPTMRAVDLPSGRRVILSDTVGFVSDLPTHLVAAFRATLEEVLEADVIVHVRDISHADSGAQRDDVLAVLEQLGVAVESNERLFEAWNKADLLDAGRRDSLSAGAAGEGGGVLVSAVSGEGVEALCAEIDGKLTARHELLEIRLDPANGADLAWLYRNGEVLERRDGEDGLQLTVGLPPEKAARWRSMAAK